MKYRSILALSQVREGPRHWEMRRIGLCRVTREGEGRPWAPHHTVNDLSSSCSTRGLMDRGYVRTTPLKRHREGSQVWGDTSVSVPE